MHSIAMSMWPIEWRFDNVYIAPTFLRSFLSVTMPLPWPKRGRNVNPFTGGCFVLVFLLAAILKMFSRRINGANTPKPHNMLKLVL